MASYVGLLLYLMTAAVTDLKQKVSVRMAVFAAIAAIVIGAAERETGIWTWIGGLLPGVCLLGLGWCTRESIGYGDGMAVLVTGIFLGFWGCFEVVSIGMMLTCPVSLTLNVCRGVSRKARIPFLPFLLAGYGIWLTAML